MKNDSKRLMIIFVIILLVLITMTSGIIYNYYKTKNEKENNINIVVKKVSLLISYNSSNKIIFNGLEPNTDYNYDFSISNNSYEYSANYKLLFDVNSKAFDGENDDFTYSLSCYTKTKDSNDTVINISNRNMPAESTTLGTGKISPDEVHYYTLNIKYTGEKSSGIFDGMITLEKAID